MVQVRNGISRAGVTSRTCRKSSIDRPLSPTRVNGNNVPMEKTSNSIKPFPSIKRSVSPTRVSNNNVPLEKSYSIRPSPSIIYTIKPAPPMYHKRSERTTSEIKPPFTTQIASQQAHVFSAASNSNIDVKSKSNTERKSSTFGSLKKEAVKEVVEEVVEEVVLEQQLCAPAPEHLSPDPLKIASSQNPSTNLHLSLLNLSLSSLNLLASQSTTDIAEALINDMEASVKLDEQQREVSQLSVLPSYKFDKSSEGITASIHNLGTDLSKEVEAESFETRDDRTHHSTDDDLLANKRYGRPKSFETKKYSKYRSASASVDSWLNTQSDCSYDSKEELYSCTDAIEDITNVYTSSTIQKHCETIIGNKKGLPRFLQNIDCSSEPNTCLAGKNKSLSNCLGTKTPLRCNTLDDMHEIIYAITSERRRS